MTTVKVASNSLLIKRVVLALRYYRNYMTVWKWTWWVIRSFFVKRVTARELELLPQPTLFQLLRWSKTPWDTFCFLLHRSIIYACLLDMHAMYAAVPSMMHPTQHMYVRHTTIIPTHICEFYLLDFSPFTSVYFQPLTRLGLSVAAMHNWYKSCTDPRSKREHSST